MSYPPTQSRGAPKATQRLRDVPLGDRESAYHGAWTGDAVLLGLVVGVLLVNGVIIWNQLGPAQEHVRRALFFGVLLVCVYWAAIVYTFKLSVSVRVGPHGLAIVRGPWRTELPWRDVSRLVERVQTHRQQRFRWVVALARDGRRLQVREDMVEDYPRFRYEVNERYRLWQDHGGTWGTTGGGPFMAREVVSGRLTWWTVLAGMVLLPGLYFAILLPETGLLGPVLIALGVICGALALRVVLTRQAYTVDARSLKAAGPLRSTELAWREVANVERARHALSGVLEASVTAGRFALALAARTDPRVESFAWYPRVPEYLILRGSGRLIRIALHRVARPDELLAWVEFYERVGRRTGDQPRRAQTATGRPARELLPPDLSAPGGPNDPWGQAASGTAASDDGALTAAGDEGQGAWEASVGDMSFVYDRTPARPPQPAAEASAQGARGDAASASEPAWAPPAGYHSGLTGSVDQLWAESQVDVEAPQAGGAYAQSGWREPEPRAGRDAYEPANAGLGPGQWPRQPQPAETPPEELETEDGLTDASESMAEMSAPWRTSPQWAPPPLPRYGPAKDQPDEQPDAAAFKDDDFLR